MLFFASAVYQSAVRLSLLDQSGPSTTASARNEEKNQNSGRPDEPIHLHIRLISDAVT